MKKIIGILLISVMCSLELCARHVEEGKAYNYFKAYRVGEVLQADEMLIGRVKSYNLYELKEILYIPLEAVIELAGSVEEEEGILYIKLKEEGEVDFKAQKQLQGTAYMNTGCIYIGNLRTYSIKVDEQVLLPLASLKIFWDIEKEDNQYRIVHKYYDLNRYIQIKENQIINLSPYFLKIDYKDVGWDGKNYREEVYENIPLEAYETIDRKISFEKKQNKIIYLTTLLMDVHELKVERDEINPYGQKDTHLFQTYQNVVRLKELDKIFIPYIVTGTMKYPVGKFKEKEEVELWRGEKKEYYEVYDKQGKKIVIPWGSIEVEKDLGAQWQQASDEEIEEYVTLKEIKSETDYLVWTDLYRQRTYVLKKDEERWKLQKVMRCSSGRNTYLTPRGEFKLEYRIPYFGMGKGFRCKNAVVIFRDYMYHSILFDKTGNYVKEGKYQLGQRASHGCIRLSEEDSKWFYENVPLGSKVWIN